MNKFDDCVHHKFNGSMYIVLVLFVDDIFLTRKDMGLLSEIKSFILRNFETQDLQETSFF